MFDLETFQSLSDEIIHELNKHANENSIYYKKIIKKLTASTKDEEGMLKLYLEFEVKWYFEKFELAMSCSNLLQQLG